MEGEKKRGRTESQLSRIEKKNPLTRRQSSHLSGNRSLKCTKPISDKMCEDIYDFVNGNLGFVVKQ